MPQSWEEFYRFESRKTIKENLFSQETPGVCDTLASPNKRTDVIALCTIETETRNKPSYQETPGVCNTLEPLISGDNINLKVSQGVKTGKDVPDLWTNNPLFVPGHRPIMPLNVEVHSNLYKRIGGSNYLKLALTRDRVEDSHPEAKVYNKSTEFR